LFGGEVLLQEFYHHCFDVGGGNATIQIARPRQRSTHEAPFVEA
jgi:hypothetical protein